MEKSEKTAFTAIFISLSIFIIKYLAARASGSIALKAEAFHTLADFIASLTIFAGLKIAKRKTRSFPYGLYKLENMASIFISFVILYTGYEIVLEVIGTDSVELKNSGFAIASILLATLITFTFTRYEKSVGKKINSPILLADAEHGYIDVMSNVIVLIAIISNAMGYELDRIAALIVVGFIAKAGLQILMDGGRVLLDASLDYETLSKVEKIVLSVPQVSELKELRGRNSGRYKFIEVSIILKVHNLESAHFISNKIERLIKEKIKNVDQVLIHYEPLRKEEIIYAVPLTDDKDYISSHFGEAPFFMLAIFRAGENSASKFEILDNPYRAVEKGKGILAAEFLAKKDVDFVVVKSDFGSKGPMYVFSNFNIQTILTNEEKVISAFDELGLVAKTDLLDKNLG